MGAKQFFLREMVVDAARDTAAEFGFEQVTVRKVAERLEASTAPIFKQFPTMAELQLAVAASVLEELKTWTARAWPHPFVLGESGGEFLNLGIGIAMYACERPRLFRILLAPDSSNGGMASAMRAFCLETMQKDRLSRQLPPPVRKVVYDRMATFVFGLAARIVMDDEQKPFEAAVAKDLYDVGTALIHYELAKLGGRAQLRGGN